MTLRVEDDALAELLDDSSVEVAVQESVFARVEHEDVLSVEVNNFHLFGGHGSSLAEAEIGDGTDLLNRVKVADEHIIMRLHLEDTVGEGDGNGHGETLGDGNDKDDDRDDNVIDHLLGEDLSTNVFVGAGLDDKNDSRGGEDSDGTDKTKETQAAANVIKLAGELSVLLLGVVGSVVDTTGAMLSDGADEGLASAADNE